MCPSELSQAIARKLRGKAAEANMTGVKLAELTGISQSQMSKLLRGTRVFDVDQLAATCSALNVSLTELVGNAILDVKREHARIQQQPRVTPLPARISDLPELDSETVALAAMRAAASKHERYPHAHNLREDEAREQYP